MPDYLCVDGPLRGHVLTSDRIPRDGDTITVDLVGLGALDVGELEQPGARYAVESSPVASEPGTLRFVAAHGLYRKPALPVALRAGVDA